MSVTTGPGAGAAVEEHAATLSPTATTHARRKSLSHVMFASAVTD
jgi:hypothetical protein